MDRAPLMRLLGGWKVGEGELQEGVNITGCLDSPQKVAGTQQFCLCHRPETPGGDCEWPPLKGSQSSCLPETYLASPFAEARMVVSHPLPDPGSLSRNHDGVDFP